MYSPHIEFPVVPRERGPWLSVEGSAASCAQAPPTMSSAQSVVAVQKYDCLVTLGCYFRGTTYKLKHIYKKSCKNNGYCVNLLTGSRTFSARTSPHRRTAAGAVQ